MRFSRRTDWDLRPNRIALLREELAREGTAVLDLTESNPTVAGLEYPGDEIREAIARAGSLVYAPEPRGLHGAREVVAHRLGVDVRRVLLTASTSEAYGWLFKLLCDPGDQ